MSSELREYVNAVRDYRLRGVELGDPLLVSGHILRLLGILSRDDEDLLIGSIERVLERGSFCLDH